MNKEEIKNRWNRIADGYNQWDSLGIDEKALMFVGATDISDTHLKSLLELKDAE